eukprot:m.89378 g.89378  ORF g.89378 m.89378 type:complete len:900 (+) comp13214_c3_seq2:259-2958(+)
MAPPLGAIIGYAIGGVIVLLVLVFAIYFCRMSKRKRRDNNVAMENDTINLDAANQTRQTEMVSNPMYKKSDVKVQEGGDTYDSVNMDKLREKRDESDDRNDYLEAEHIPEHIEAANRAEQQKKMNIPQGHTSMRIKFVRMTLEENFGFILGERADGVFAVSYISPEGMAMNILKKDDIVHLINDKASQDMNFGDICSLMESSLSVHLVISREGDERKIERMESNMSVVTAVVTSSSVSRAVTLPMNQNESTTDKMDDSNGVDDDYEDDLEMVLPPLNSRKQDTLHSKEDKEHKDNEEEILRVNALYTGADSEEDDGENSDQNRKNMEYEDADFMRDERAHPPMPDIQECGSGYSKLNLAVKNIDSAPSSSSSFKRRGNKDDKVDFVVVDRENHLDSFGFTLGETGEGFLLISEVEPGGNADGKLFVGDVLVEVGNQQIEDLTKSDVIDYVKKNLCVEFSLVRRKGEIVVEKAREHVVDTGGLEDNPVYEDEVFMGSQNDGAGYDHIDDLNGATSNNGSMAPNVMEQHRTVTPPSIKTTEEPSPYDRLMPTSETEHGSFVPASNNEPQATKSSFSSKNNLRGKRLASVVGPPPSEALPQRKSTSSSHYKSYVGAPLRPGGSKRSIRPMSSIELPNNRAPSTSSQRSRYHSTSSSTSFLSTTSSQRSNSSALRASPSFRSSTSSSRAGSMDSWYAGDIDRLVAENRLKRTYIGPNEGSYLVRLRKDGQVAYSMCIGTAGRKIIHHALNRKENNGEFILNGQSLPTKGITDMTLAVECVTKMMSEKYNISMFPFTMKQSAAPQVDPKEKEINHLPIISRDHVERRLQETGRDGAYILRWRKEPGQAVISAYMQGSCLHYRLFYRDSAYYHKGMALPDTTLDGASATVLRQNMIPFPQRMSFS